MKNNVSKNKKITRKERYQFLINARNFHYDNFNKWMTYFYVAIGALFVGYYTIASSENMNTEKIILITLGYITSLFWYWSSKGYYFWNINFITLVNDCERNTLKLKEEKRVYFVFANKNTQNNYLNPLRGANISTSKIAILFSFVVSIVWSILLLEKLKEIELIEINFTCELIITIFGTLILSYTIPKYFLKSKIDHFPDLKISQSE
ncbi:hypothetical protein [Polaribacter sp. Hel_I_88]|uniref:RipA family octameric membrane protein n=1 Tax=Polaribacter sp. Hel_I_88 TaxID=1250006 RepID=UPI00047C193F|nr:hypothetical protein [Polaribacter sp. Hel_I_88]